MTFLNFFDTREKRLRNFFAASFHQDWRHIHQTTHAVVEDYASGYVHEPEFLRAVVEDLRWLRTQAKESSELWDIIVERYGSEYDGGLVGQNAHDWVAAVADQIEGAL